MIKMKKSTNRWSSHVARHSQDANVEEDVFTWTNPHKIALSLKKSTSKNSKSKSTAFVSAMSKLNLHIAKSGPRLDAGQRIILEQAKDQLRIIFKMNLGG